MTAIFSDNSLQQQLVNVGGILAVALIATTPFSTSIPIIITGILFVLWLISGQFLNLPSVLKNLPIATLALILFGLLFIGISYSSVSVKAGLSIWGKYRELFLLLILLPFFAQQRFRDWAIRMFVAASIVTLIISYAMFFDLIPRPFHAATLKSIITHSIMVVFFAFFCAQQVFLTKNLQVKVLWSFLLLITLHNLYFVAMGRTGQLLGILLTVLFCIQHLSIKKTLLVLSVCVISLTLFLTYADIGFRLTEGMQNVLNYDANLPETESSMGRRITFWKNTSQLINEKLWFGHGTGSFENEYSRIAPNQEIMTVNPHNEFFYLGAQLGLTGLLVFCGFLFYLYCCQKKLPEPDRWLAQGLLLSLIVTCLFNTPLLDHTEGHWK